VDGDLADLRLGDTGRLDCLPEPPLHEAVEVIAGVPDVDDDETVIRGPGDMECLPFTQVPAARRRYLMKSISSYFGSGQRSSLTTFSSWSAASRTSSIAGTCLSRAYSASSRPSIPSG
jgi:hypothetical protein